MFGVRVERVTSTHGAHIFFSCRIDVSHGDLAQSVVGFQNIDDAKIASRGTAKRATLARVVL
jgi:hypothetical protein